MSGPWWFHYPSTTPVAASVKASPSIRSGTAATTNRANNRSPSAVSGPGSVLQQKRPILGATGQKFNHRTGRTCWFSTNVLPGWFHWVALNPSNFPTALWVSTSWSLGGIGVRLFSNAAQPGPLGQMSAVWVQAILRNQRGIVLNQTPQFWPTTGYWIWLEKMVCRIGGMRQGLDKGCNMMYFRHFGL